VGCRHADTNRQLLKMADFRLSSIPGHPSELTGSDPQPRAEGRFAKVGIQFWPRPAQQSRTYLNGLAYFTRRWGKPRSRADSPMVADAARRVTSLPHRSPNQRRTLGECSSDFCISSSPFFECHCRRVSLPTHMLNPFNPSAPAQPVHC
jgi:hypothetical protein